MLPDKKELVTYYSPIPLNVGAYNLTNSTLITRSKWVEVGRIGIGKDLWIDVYTAQEWDASEEIIFPFGNDHINLC